MKLNPYLHFNGTCEEAIHFYKDVLNGEIVMIMRFSQMPENDSCTIEEKDKNKVMHATLTFGQGNTLLCSDDITQGLKQGNNAHMSLNIPEEAAAEKVYNSLSEGGHQTMPFGPVFWGGKFGMVTDKFGVHWMVSSAH